mmetsp:Transcript_7724/g.20829  ORF Transcript_7724/g.20829 Transcript_7724/m.20829 type:complete len:475 (+) Transcript_7724:288-1712(+)
MRGGRGGGAGPRPEARIAASGRRGDIPRPGAGGAAPHRPAALGLRGRRRGLQQEQLLRQARLHMLQEERVLGRVQPDVLGGGRGRGRLEVRGARPQGAPVVLLGGRELRHVGVLPQDGLQVLPAQRVLGELQRRVLEALGAEPRGAVDVQGAGRVPGRAPGQARGEGGGRRHEALLLRGRHAAGRGGPGRQGRLREALAGRCQGQGPWHLRLRRLGHLQRHARGEGQLAVRGQHRHLHQGLGPGEGGRPVRDVRLDRQGGRGRRVLPGPPAGPPPRPAPAGEQGCLPAQHQLQVRIHGRARGALNKGSGHLPRQHLRVLPEPWAQRRRGLLHDAVPGLQRRREHDGQRFAQRQVHADQRLGPLRRGPLHRGLRGGVPPVQGHQLLDGMPRRRNAPGETSRLLRLCPQDVARRTLLHELAEGPLGAGDHRLPRHGGAPRALDSAGSSAPQAARPHNSRGRSRRLATANSLRLPAC